MIPAPTTPVTNKAEPALVNFPKSAIAKGQTDGHNKAFANPNRGIKKMEILLGNNITIMLIIMPNIVDENKESVWLMYLGMRNIPIK